MLTFSRPLRDSLGEGQVGALVFFLFGFAFWAYTMRRDKLTGAVVALVTAVKVFPVLWLGFFLVKRNWRAFAATVATGSVLLVTTVALTGVPAWITFFTRIFPAYSAGMPNVDNQSPSAFLYRLIPGATLYGDYDPFDNLTIGWVRLASVVFSLAILTFSAWWIRRYENGDRLQSQIEFASVIPTMLLITPLVWDHYLMWLIIPMYLILHSLANRACLPLAQVFLLASFSTSWIFLQYGRSWYAMSNYPVGLMSLGLYATLIVFVSLSYLMRVPSEGIIRPRSTETLQRSAVA